MSKIFGGGGSDRAAQAYQAQQAQMAQNQAQTYQQVMPEYYKSLDWLMNSAGLGNFHPANYGGYTSPAPGAASSGDTSQQPHNNALGALYNPPPQTAGTWTWDAPGTQTMPAPLAINQDKSDIFGNSNSRKAATGQGDPLAQMGPSPYKPQPVAAPPVAAPAAAPTPARPQSNMQQYMQSTPGMQSFNANAGSIGNHGGEQAFNSANPGGNISALSSGTIGQHQMLKSAALGTPGMAQPGASTAQSFTAKNPNASSSPASGAMGPSPYAASNSFTSGPPATGGVNNDQMGIYNDPADALRNAQAQDDINQQQYLQQQNMKAQLGARGLEDSSILGGGLQQLSQGALQNYAAYRRSLAMNAQNEQSNRVQQAMAAQQFALGGGQQAASNYGSLVNSALQQQQMQQSLLQQLGSSMGQMYFMNPMGGGGFNPMATYNQSGMSNLY